MNKAAVQRLAQQRKEPSWMRNQRLTQFQRFTQLPATSFTTYGLGIGSSTKDLHLEALSLSKNHHISLDAPKEVAFFRQTEALNHLPRAEQTLFSRLTPEENEKVWALHRSMLQDLTLIRIPKKAILNNPLRLTTQLGRESLSQHVIIVAEENSEATIIDHTFTESTAPNRLFTHSVEIWAHPNAKLRYAGIHEGGKNTHMFVYKTATLKRNSTVNMEECVLGGSFLKTETRNCLEGEGAEGTITGVFVGNDQDRCDIKTDSLHQARKTNSNMLIKGVLQDEAKTTYRGLVKIAPQAASCNGYQKQDTLLLSEQAAVDSVPNLEIDHNEVRCSHGATSGQLDEQHIFYLTSRGLSREKAVSLLIDGFFAPVLENLPASLAKEIRQRIDHKRRGD